MTNEGQLPMMKSMLNSAKKAGFPMHLFHCFILSTNKDPASYNTKQFQSITIKKLEVILMNMNLDKEVLWVDNDIYFFENIISDVKRYMGSFVMQDDLWGFCTGFFLVRSSPNSKRLIQNCIDRLKNSAIESQNDQHVFNNEYNSMTKSVIFGLKIQKLPQDEYPNGEVYFCQGRKSKSKMVHCNWIETTAEKVQILKTAGLWNESDDGFNMTTRYSI